MNGKLRRIMVYTATALWVASLLGTVAAICILIHISLMEAPSSNDLTRTLHFAVAIGFLPWVLAYAGTRVLYGIETIMEG